MSMASNTEHSHKHAFVLLIVAVSFAFFWLVKGFWQPVFWAVLLAIMFTPLNRWLNELCRQKPRLSALLTVLGIVLGVVLPLFVLALGVMQESMALYDRVLSGKIDLQKPVRMMEQSLPVAADFLEKTGLDLDKVKDALSQTALKASQFFANHLFRIGQSTVQMAVQTALMLYLLYFFLKDGRGILKSIVRTLPLDENRQWQLFHRFADVAQATVKGTLVIGLVQGGIGGIVFWLLGIQGALLWGVLMVLLSVLPVVGSALIWGPTALILISTGNIFQGVLLLVVGAVGIGLADNLLRPALVGRETRLPDYLILLATLGGLAVYGLSGFIIGPICAAVFVTVWQMAQNESAITLSE